MNRISWRRGLVASALVLASGVAVAQGTSTPMPGPSVPARQPALTPALPPLTPTPTPALTTQQQGTVPQAPGSIAQPTQPLTNPALPTQPLANPAQPTNPGLPPLNGQVPGAPLTAGTGQSIANAPLPTRTDNAQTAFRALDPMGRGYVTRADTDKINGFTGFDNADTDRDGRLTPEEFYNAWKNFAQ